MKLIFSLITLEKYLKDNEPGSIQKNIEQLEQEMKTDSDKVRKIKEQRIEILKKRKDKITGARESKQIIENQLNMIEISGVKLGFWFAQQGSIYAFVVLIFVYVYKMGKIDEKYGVDE